MTTYWINKKTMTTYWINKKTMTTYWINKKIMKTYWINKKIMKTYWINKKIMILNKKFIIYLQFLIFGKYCHNIKTIYKLYFINSFS